ncbi:MAG TPA: DUF4249 domain-containing protein [Chitinophagaceae bacterium]|nr:DUF4249 domain-containing protein [Chitinophagaceae bacterium]
MKLFQNLIGLFLLCFVAGCKEEYYPKVKSGNQSILVVEGVLNSGEGPTTITLSRTLRLEDSLRLLPVNNAQVSVESKSGSVVPLYDFSGNGRYMADQLNLNAADEYRLQITTTDGMQYVSDFVSVRQNPPIDSVNWERNEQGVQLYVNTHNAENNTRYYRWEFQETWELRSGYFSTWKMVNGIPTPRAMPEESVYLCWRNFNSSNIILASTAQLISDVINHKLLLSIPAKSEKLGERYSLLVNQYALDKKGYEFYQLLRKNTETLGSIFDAQPSESGGNMHAVSDSTAQVIGFITAAAVQQKRIFISRNDVPDWNFRINCEESITVPNNPESIRKNFSTNYLPYSAKQLGPTVQEYYGARPECVDCTLRGGSTEKPFYW